MKIFTRRRWLLLSAGVLVLLAAVAVWFGIPRSKISLASFDKIEVGMTQAEVEAILGGPARAEFDGFLIVRLDRHKALGPSREMNKGEYCHEWRGSYAIIHVVFDEESGRVLRASFNWADAAHPWIQSVKTHLRKLPGL
jgi:hypothetical protein